MIKLLGRILLITGLCLAAGIPASRAQSTDYKFDLGVGVGMSGYLGDVNESNVFRNPGFAVQLKFGYLLDSRWQFRGLFTTASLRGDSSQFSNVLPGESRYRFSSQTFDLGGRVEFNFLPYGMGETYKRLKRWSPYVGVGAGVTMASAKGKAYAAFSLPLAAGVRFKPAPRVNLGLEFCMTKVFGDHLDGEISDLYGIKSSFLKNTDWHGNLMLSVTYEFGKRCETCHYVD